MRWCGSRSRLREMAMLVMALALPVVSAIPQEPDRQVQRESLDGSLRDLQDQLRALKLTVREVHEDLTRSRAEAGELRHDLEETRKQLLSLKHQMNVTTAQAADTSAVTGRPAAAQLVSKTTDPRQGETPGAAEKDEGGNTEDRLNKLEEDQKLLEGKVNDQDQTKVESGSKNRVRLSGIALLNVFGTRGSVDNLDLPDVALPKGVLGSRGSFGATVRQTQLALEVFGPRLAGARTRADVQFDFFGGFPDTLEGVTAGLVRMRTARLHFEWARTAIVAGQDAPFFSPLSPSSLASLGTPALSYAGNLWTWTPQVRVEHQLTLSEGSTLLLQAGILDPLTGQPPPYQAYRTPQAGEKSGQPAYATRIAWTGSAFGQAATVGVGGYYARQNWGLGRRVDAWAGTADWDLPLGRWLSLKGELYRGRAIGGLGAGLGRSVLYSGPFVESSSSLVGLNSAGGWSQLKFKLSEKLEFNGVFGEDYPFSADLNRFPEAETYVDPSIARNQSAFINSIYHARSNLLFSLEYRRLWTSAVYPAKYTADHLDIGIGVLF